MSDSLGKGRSIVLLVLAVAAVLCGVHAISADAVTTPARFGGDHRGHGTDTVIVGVGWILMGAAIAAPVVIERLGARAATVIGVAPAAAGGLCWLAVL